MKVKHILLLIIGVLSLCANTAFAQKREMRATWVASVFNLDWPSSKTLTPQAQRDQFIILLNQVQAAGFNAVFVQVRCSSDAFYPSDLEPWSEWLTGVQGRAPSPAYDPLAFMIAEVQNRGMEFHAWINPFRAITSNTSSSIAANHISKTKPEWMLPYSTLTVINPGVPEARNYVHRIVMDIVRKYPVDGIHFDDYFYPYPVSGVTLNDIATYEANKREIPNISDWRRDNINLFVRDMRDSIKAFDKRIKFGISPFGIWRNVSRDATGSATNGLQSYDDIYADSRKWVQEGWIDYIVPQLYWPFGLAVADYGILTNWWSKNVPSNRHLYIGQGAYRADPALATPWAAGELPKQLRFNRTIPGVVGSIFYRTVNITRNHGGISDSLRTSVYAKLSLPPTMPWLDDTAPLPPTNLSATITQNTVKLNWVRSQQAGDGEFARRYVIYRFANNEPKDITNENNIIYITAKNEDQYIDNNTISGSSYTYVVTALDRLSNESTPSNPAALLFTTTIQLPIQDITVKTYPNPFTDRLQIELSGISSAPKTVRIYTSNGVKIQEINWANASITDHLATFELGNLASGAYLIIIDNLKPIRVLKY